MQLAKRELAGLLIGLRAGFLIGLRAGLLIGLRAGFRHSDVPGTVRGRQHNARADADRDRR